MRSFPIDQVQDSVRGSRELSRDEAIGPVVVPLKVGGISPGIASAVLGQKEAVGMVGPAGAGTADIIGSEPRSKTAFTAGASDVLHEAAHRRTGIEPQESLLLNQARCLSDPNAVDVVDELPPPLAGIRACGLDGLDLGWVPGNGNDSSAVARKIRDFQTLSMGAL
jgi:hypothetical protein